MFAGRYPCFLSKKDINFVNFLPCRIKSRILLEKLKKTINFTFGSDKVLRVIIINPEQIDSSTIDGNVKFVTLSVQLYSDVTSVNLVLCPTKLIIIVIILE